MVKRVKNKRTRRIRYVQCGRTIVRMRIYEARRSSNTTTEKEETADLQPAIEETVLDEMIAVEQDSSPKAPQESQSDDNNNL